MGLDRPNSLNMHTAVSGFVTERSNSKQLTDLLLSRYSSGVIREKSQVSCLLLLPHRNMPVLVSMVTEESETDGYALCVVCRKKLPCFPHTLEPTVPLAKRSSPTSQALEKVRTNNILNITFHCTASVISLSSSCAASLKCFHRCHRIFFSAPL